MQQWQWGADNSGIHLSDRFNSVAQAQGGGKGLANEHDLRLVSSHPALIKEAEGIKATDDYEKAAKASVTDKWKWKGMDCEA